MIVILRFRYFIYSLIQINSKSHPYGLYKVETLVALANSRGADPRRVLGRKRKRPSSEDIAFFKSVGVAAQDAVAPPLSLRNAEKWGLGQKVRW